MSEKCRFRVVSTRDSSPEVKRSEVTERSGGEGGAPQLGTKRRYHDDGVCGREELWGLHDVIFTDRVQSVRVGRVLKVDGLFAAVHFPVRSEGVRSEEEMEEEVEGVLERCRLLRKDDLVVCTVSTHTLGSHDNNFLYSRQQNR